MNSENKKAKEHTSVVGNQGALQCQNVAGEDSVRNLTPRWDSRDDGEHITLQVALPGVEREDVEIVSKASYVTLKASRIDTVGESWNPRGFDLVPSNYALTWKLSSSLDISSIKAGLHQGVLQITIARKEEVKPRTISISG